MNTPQILQFAAALVFTLALIGLCAFIARAFLKRLPAFSNGLKSNRSRLAVVEWRPLDGKHTLFLIKRDKVEHLIVLSPTTAPLLIEKNILDSPPLSSIESPASPRPLTPGLATPFPLGPAVHSPDDKGKY